MRARFSSKAIFFSASRGRFRRAVEQQELGHSFVDKELEQNFGEEASPAARRDESGPMTLFGTATASRRGPTGGLGAAAPVRAASGARAPAYNLPTWQLRRRFHTHTHTHTDSESASKTPGAFLPLRGRTKSLALPEAVAVRWRERRRSRPHPSRRRPNLTRNNPTQPQPNPTRNNPTQSTILKLGPPAAGWLVVDCRGDFFRCLS